ncbi:Kinesin-like protein kif15 [Dissophora globulifera]|uniref:Kinesin-like protein kif15 n=1 Tax=Dissophora globulifera TaxID=979702 RepID=A0A9P6RSM3_9FUNG|nr:Kinesin-like protein kif15 [Dissophora globulifera]
MECTFLLGKPPPPRRKKAHSEVEILQERLESIESAYSERLSQMEALLHKVMPNLQGQDLTKLAAESSILSRSTAITTPTLSQQRLEAALTGDNEWVDVDSIEEAPQLLSPKPVISPGIPSTSRVNSTKQSSLQKEIHGGGLFTSAARALPSTNSPSSIHTHGGVDVHTLSESDGDEDGLGELAATMDRLRIFDASHYLGKGTMLFTSMDQDKFWDEEITFDVHESYDFQIPAEALIMPPVEVIDALFDIYYSHYFVFLPMVQKTTLLQALEDRHEPQSIFLLNSVFMAAALTGDCDHPSCFTDPNDPKTLSTPFFERARMVMDYCIGIPRVSTVQGIIMLSRYPKIPGLGNHYIQIGILMAVGLGLHRKCDRWIPDEQVQETRKRVFWCIYVTDSVAASITGRRPLIDDAEIDVPMVMPMALEGELEYSTTLFLVHMCKLWRIFRQVKQYVFNVVEVQDMVPGSLPKRYEQQLLQWQLQLPAVLRFTFNIETGDTGAMYNARGGVAQMLYESTLILLHKPYMTGNEHHSQTPNQSQDICIKAASKITDIARVLVKTYSRTFETTNVPEYSLTNALRIQVMFMRSIDPKVAEQSQVNFDYVVRLFREFYSSPRANISDQTINCVLTFFDEFLNAVQGLSESTVHVCASAIKNIAIARRSKISLGRVPFAGAGGGTTDSRVAISGDSRNLSRMVKIGREERAKARVSSTSSPSQSQGNTTSVSRKRHSHIHHERDQRHQEQRFTPTQNLQREWTQRLESTSLSLLSDQDPNQDGGVAFDPPGKVQKVSQYIGPFGGPVVMESFQQYQTSTAILNQSRSNSAIPRPFSTLTGTGDVTQSLQQQPEQMQQQQQEQQQQQQQQQRFTISEDVFQQHQHQQQRTFQLQQRFYDQPQSVALAGQSLATVDALSPSFWGDFTATEDAQSTLQMDTDSLNSSIFAGGFGTPTTSTSDALTRTNSAESGVASSRSSLYGMPAAAVLSPVQQEHAAQPQQYQQQLTSGLFLPENMSAAGGTAIEKDEALGAGQIQTLLGQTLGVDTHNHGRSAFQQPQQELVQALQSDPHGAYGDFHLASWDGALWAGGSEHVKVYVRVRPPNERELASDAYTSSSQGSQNYPTITSQLANVANQTPSGHSRVTIGAGSKVDNFTYDCVGGELTSQEHVFNDVGRTIVEQCVKGYNGTIFAYGQTGSGKTYTMQGPSTMTNLANHQERGIIPRCLEYLFELIAAEEQMISSVKYLCKASYIEIYNEMIYDLLDNSTTARATREDIKRGVYVDGVTEESIHNPEDAYRLFELGAANRHTSATAMNRESSRSHTVLTLTIQSMALVDGINHIRESRFNLVDLAGSERQKQANTEGMRLKEAGNINRSLLCLGSVINALGEIAGGHSRHVHYRDSRLTFLLKDSLGGNSNTFIVANVSPSALCYQESLSTLRFAQRAKMIKNKAVVNEDIQGNVNELRAEIQRLKSEQGLKHVSGDSGDASVNSKLYLTTLAKLRTEQEERVAMEQKGFMLDEACKAREKQIQSAQLIIKFKESALASYRKGAASAALESEKAALQEEIVQLRKQLDFHPEVLKVKAENLSLREMLQNYEKYQAGLEEQEERQKKDKEYLYDLSGKLLEMEQENEALRTRRGSATPRSNMDVDEFEFPRVEGIEDIMQESPPKVRDADRRFSSDMKSLLQRVTKSRQAEYRRLSGNLGNLDAPLLDSAERDATGSSTSGLSTPLKKTQRAGLLAHESSPGINLSDSISADSKMHSDDTVEMTLLKRDLDRLKDENSVLVDEKASLEKEFSDSQFQLIAMERCLEQATNQAEQLGRELQNSRQAHSTMEEDAAMRIMDLNKEMQEQVELMEKMRQASIDVEEELKRLRDSHQIIEQQLKAVTKDLDDSRQRLLENQKEYDHQVEYNMKRINEFQDKESRWDSSRVELVKAKEELEKQLEQEKGVESDLKKEIHRLSENSAEQEAEKHRLETVRKSLTEEIERLREASADSAEAHQTKLQQELEQHGSMLKTEQARNEALSSELKAAQDGLEVLRAQFEEINQSLETKTREAAESLQVREQQLEEQIRALQAKSIQDLEECLSKTRSEGEDSIRTLRQSLVDSHEEEVRRLKSEMEEQAHVVDEVRSSLKESIDKAERALETKQRVETELSELREQHRVLERDVEVLRQEKCRFESQIEAANSKCKKLESTLDEQKQELGKMSQQLQQEQWEKERVNTAKSELMDKISEMARKVGETEQKLDQARDQHRMLDMEYRTVQDELEDQLNKARNDLAVKTNENMLNEEYKRKFRELRAQFADLGPTITERQQQGFHERELKRTMEMERVREEMSKVLTRSVQLEANLALAQEMNEQLLEDAKASTAKIAEEMEVRLKEVEIQRQSAEQEVEHALEAVQQKTVELQALEEQAVFQKEKIRIMEEELEEERAKIEQLEGTLNEGKALQEEKEATEKELHAQELKQQLKEEQLMAQRQLLIRMKEEQQARVKEQLMKRDKTRAHFERLATENGKLMEQVRDLGMVNASMLKHQNPKQKLQYHVKIKQENNELRIENQRLMFRAIELEERLGNKENVESLRKQVREMHGASSYQTSLSLPLDAEISADPMGMEMVKGLHDEMPIHRSPSPSPALSSDTSMAPGPAGTGAGAGSVDDKSRMDARLKTLTAATVVGQKRRADVNDYSSVSGSIASRKKPVTPATRSALVPSTARERTASTSSSVTSSSGVGAEADAVSNISLGPRARAKAAADAMMAAAKNGRRTPAPFTSATSSQAGPNKAVNSLNRVAKAATTPVSRVSNHEALLRGARSGGAVSKHKPAVSSVTKAKGTTATLPTIGSASAQRALAREARLAAASASATTASISITTSASNSRTSTISESASKGDRQERSKSHSLPPSAPSETTPSATSPVASPAMPIALESFSPPSSPPASAEKSVISTSSPPHSPPLSSVALGTSTSADADEAFKI